MDAMKKAIMARRMKLADLGEGEEAQAEGLLDDKDISEKDVDGLAPDVMGNSGDVEFEIEAEKRDEPMTNAEEMPEEKEGDRSSEIEMIMSKDDLGKPGIKGKVAAKMMEALKKLKG